MRAVKWVSILHYNAMPRVMQYLLDIPERGWLLKPAGTLDGKSKFLFRISG